MDYSAEKEILQAILNLVNQGHTIRFVQDWGGNSVTLSIDGKHTHCGMFDEDFEKIIKDLHQTLVDNRGLSFA